MSSLYFEQFAPAGLYNYTPPYLLQRGNTPVWQQNEPVYHYKKFGSRSLMILKRISWWPTVTIELIAKTLGSWINTSHTHFGFLLDCTSFLSKNSHEKVRQTSTKSRFAPIHWWDQRVQHKTYLYHGLLSYNCLKIRSSLLKDSIRPSNLPIHPLHATFPTSPTICTIVHTSCWFWLCMSWTKLQTIWYSTDAFELITILWSSNHNLSTP